MSGRTVIEDYIDGAWNVICDRCGRKRKNFQCTLQMIPEQPNLMVCTDTCLDVHNPQFDQRGVLDNPSVPTVRSDTDNNAPDVGDYADGYTAPLTYQNLFNNGVV